MIKRDLYYERIPTKSLREDVRYLGNILGKVIKKQEGESFFKLVEIGEYENDDIKNKNINYEGPKLGNSNFAEKEKKKKLSVYKNEGNISSDHLASLAYDHIQGLQDLGISYPIWPRNSFGVLIFLIAYIINEEAEHARD